MKRFIVSIMSVTVFCIGLGAIVENVGARFKSDEKALALIKQARIAIGGDQAIADVRSMIIRGNSTHTFEIGTETRTDTGEVEIAMQLPDKLSKMVKMGKHDGPDGAEHILNEKRDVVIVRTDKGEGGGIGTGIGEGKEKVVVRRTDGPGENIEVEKIIATGKDGEFKTSDGKKVIVRTAEGKNGELATTDGKRIMRHGDGKEIEKVVAGDKLRHFRVEGDAGAHHAKRQNELLRTTLSLLLTAPEGMDVSYTFGGEADLDGTSCNIVNASFGGQTFKLYLSKASSLPVMVSYQGYPRVIHFRTKAPEAGDVSKGDVVMFNHKVDAPQATEFQVRFADYRGAGGIQLPYKWTTTAGGLTTEVFDVAVYEINPANIADRFKDQKVMVRTKKEGK